MQVVASYPLGAEHVVARLSGPVEALDRVSFSLASGLGVLEAASDAASRDRIVLSVEPMSAVPLTVDHVVIHAGKRQVFGPPFAHGPLSAMEIKFPHAEPRFPFASRLVGVHASVACCTGCNGGVHDRGLIVLNEHLGGGWSGIWVRTTQRIEGPYPRWQRMLFAGGVIHDHGSTEVVDHGWMEISRGGEEPHHPPPPLPVSSADVPAELTTSLRTRSLDGTWVEFSDVVVDAAERLEPSTDGGTDRLPYTEITFHDQSGVRSIAYLFQQQRDEVNADTRINTLRGFVHAEAPGRYVLLTDKPEDIEL